MVFHLMRTVSCPLYLLALATSLCVSTDHAGADLLGIAAGSTIDHAMDRADQVVSEARNAALAIEAQTNEDVTARLDQVQDILNNTQKGLAALEKQTFVDMADLTNRIEVILKRQQEQIGALEQTFMSDLSKKIREAECASDRILQDQLKDALGKVGVLLGTHEITITPPVLYEGEHNACGAFLLHSCRVSRTFAIYTPFSETYREIKSYLEDRLNAVQENTPAASVVDTNALIADLAKRTTCFTLANDQTYEAEFVKYSTVVRQWNTVLVLGGQL
jgi:hypothetical protein